MKARRCARCAAPKRGRPTAEDDAITAGQLDLFSAQFKRVDMPAPYICTVCINRQFGGHEPAQSAAELTTRDTHLRRYTAEHGDARGRVYITDSLPRLEDRLLATAELIDRWIESLDARVEMAEKAVACAKAALEGREASPIAYDFSRQRHIKERAAARARGEWAGMPDRWPL